jgi:hypothetical protein
VAFQRASSGNVKNTIATSRGMKALCSLIVLPDWRITGNRGIDPMTECSVAWARLVPELLVVDINKSLRFWRDVCGFAVLFDRPDEGFAYLDLGGAQSGSFKSSGDLPSFSRRA